MKEMVLLAEQILTSLRHVYQRGQVVSSDVCVVGPLSIAAMSTSDDALQERALTLMLQADIQEGFWTSTTLKHLVKRVLYVVREDSGPVEEGSAGPLSKRMAPSLYEKLTKLCLPDE